MRVMGAFAGLRDAEIKRLDWSEIDLVRGHIEVKASKAKSARRRIVQIHRPYEASCPALLLLEFHTWSELELWNVSNGTNQLRS
jgi:hypothetical protein